MPNRQDIYTKPVRQMLLLAQLLLLYVPFWRLFDIRTDNGDIPVSICYLFCVVFLPCLAMRLRTLRLPPWWLTGLFVYIWVLALLRMPAYGLSKNILHWLFGAYLLLVILNVGADLEREDWLRLLEAGACLFAIMHFLYLLYHFDTVVWLVGGYFTGERIGAEGVYLPFLTRGGRALDCAWLALGGFFVRGRKKAVYVTYALLVAFAGCSRAGIVAVGLLILWSLVWDPMYRLSKKNLKWYFLYAAAVLAILFCSGMAQAVLGRMMVGTKTPAEWFGIEVNVPTQDQLENSMEHYGGDTTQAILSGRGALWGLAPKVFASDPLGCGVGNAVRVMRRDYGFDGPEDVVHNVFLQWLLDEGIPGGIWYIGLVAAFLARQWKRRPRFFSTPFDGYFAAYLVLSLVQFHGGEALMFFVLGIYLLQIDAKLLPLLPAKGAKA